MGEYAIASIKTSDGQTADFMRHHLELVINSYIFFLLFFAQETHTEKNRWRVLLFCIMSVDINKTKRQPHTCPYGQRNIQNISFFMYNFYTYIFKYCYKKWFDIYSTRGEEGK